MHAPAPGEGAELGNRARFLGLAREMHATEARVHAARRQGLAAEERMRTARAERRVYLIDQGDGMSELRALLPVELATAIHDRLTRQAHTLTQTDDEARNLDQLRAMTAPVTGSVRAVDTYRPPARLRALIEAQSPVCVSPAAIARPAPAISTTARPGPTAGPRAPTTFSPSARATTRSSTRPVGTSSATLTTPPLPSGPRRPGSSPSPSRHRLGQCSARQHRHPTTNRLRTRNPVHTVPSRRRSAAPRGP